MATRVAGKDAMANGSTMVMSFLGWRLMRPLFLVGHVLSWRERYVQNYVFAFCACGWGLELSTKLFAGKVCFYVLGDVSCPTFEFIYIYFSFTLS
jgi:hypothetical protein